MYRHNVKVRRQRNFIILLLTAIVLSVTTLVSWIIIHRDVSKPGDSTNAAPIVTDIEESETPKLKIDERQFSLELPTDWKLARKDTRPYTFWEWHSTKKNEDDKVLVLYMDGPPADQAFNQLLPLSRDETGFFVGSLSDNCVNFTPDAQAARQQGQTRQSKWQGVTFICDIPNSLNQAIGTGSTDGLNKITMTGPVSGKHDYFFLYTDHNIHPNSTIFTQAMESFKVK